MLKAGSALSAESSEDKEEIDELLAEEYGCYLLCGRLGGRERPP